MGNTCKPMAVSFHCMTKFTTIKKKNSQEKKKTHTYGVWEDANNDSICKAAKETQILKKINNNNNNNNNDNNRLLDSVDESKGGMI